jgi:hypothetical protein
MGLGDAMAGLRRPATAIATVGATGPEFPARTGLTSSAAGDCRAGGPGQPARVRPAGAGRAPGTGGPAASGAAGAAAGESAAGGSGAKRAEIT